MAQKVVFYWNKTQAESPKSFLNFLIKKRKPYFDALTEFAEVFLMLGEDRYLGGRVFQGGLKYVRGDFTKNNSRIEANAIIDRTLGFSFPSDAPELRGRVINCRKFKKIAGDKYEFSRYLPEYAPRTILCEGREELERELSALVTGELMVLKPKTGHKGIGVMVGDKQALLAADIKYPILLQEFIETRGGFEGHQERHDIRLVILNGKIVHSFVRLAMADPYRANISQGGDYIELSYKEIPEPVKNTAESLAFKIKKEFENPFYSMDFGISGKRVVIFELNSKIGLPEPDKKNFPIFREEFVKTVKEKLQNSSI